MENKKVVEKIIPYGFLYVSDNAESKEAKEILSKGGVRLYESKTTMDPQTGLLFIAPVFITREGTFRGLEAIQAYLGWFVYDPLSPYRRSKT